MSEPWIKVYVSDMRGDPKISALTPAQRYLLIHLWDLAKNGPGDPSELRDVDGKPMTPKRIMQVCGVYDWGGYDPDDPESDTPIDPPSEVGTYQGVKATIDKMVKIGLCTRSDDGAITFPTLVRRQGIDRTAAERKRRQRAKDSPNGTPPSHGNVTEDVTPVSRQSHGDVTPEFTGEEPESHGECHGDVTAQMPDARTQSSEEPPEGLKPLVEQARPINDAVRVWQAYERHHPRSVLTPARRKRIRDRLRHYDADTLIAAIDGNHRDPWCCGDNAEQREYHDLELILRDAAHVERYAAVPLDPPARRVVRSGYSARELARMAVEGE